MTTKPISRFPVPELRDLPPDIRERIEAVQQKLCELLVASRLGIPDVPVGALEKTVKSLEDVLEGLRVLAFSGKN